MSHTDVHDRPVVKTFDIGRHSAVTEIAFELTALTEATLRYGKVERTSRDGRTVLGRANVFDGGLGNHVIEVTSSGPFELAIDAGPDRVAHFTTEEERPATYRWQFVADPMWSGGSINEDASRIAQLELEGKPLPSTPAGPEVPGKAVPAMPSTITRPWAPSIDSEGTGISRPRRAAHPIEDDGA